MWAMVNNVLDKKSKKKTKVETLREWEEKKRRDRWIVGWVFVVMAGVSLVLWWKGQDDGGVFEREAVVWEKSRESGVKELQELRSFDTIDTRELRSEIEGLVEGLEGTYIIYAKSLNSEARSWELEVGSSTEVVQAASLIKLPVMVGVYRMTERNEIDLDEIYKLREEDRIGGSGSLVSKPKGYEVTIRKLVWHMGNESDNTAFAAIVNMVGKDKLQSEFLRMGLVNASIQRNEITPKETAKLLDELYGYELVSEDGAEEILEAMTDTWYEDRIPAGIIKSQELRDESREVRVAHKVGTEIGVVSDAGIVFTDKGDYLLVIMSEGVREAEAKEVVPDISRAVWEWVSQIKN